MYTPIQHRAGTACQSCRMKKIKCNVLNKGTPCTHCETHDRYCYVAKSKRGKLVLCSISRSKDVRLMAWYHGRKPRSYYKNKEQEAKTHVEVSIIPSGNICSGGTLVTPPNAALKCDLPSILNITSPETSLIPGGDYNYESSKTADDCRCDFAFWRQHH